MGTLGGAQGTDPLLLADALVGWANVQGGVDNITVALARIDPPGTVPMTPPDTEAVHAAAHREEGTPDGHVLS